MSLFDQLIGPSNPRRNDGLMPLDPYGRDFDARALGLEDGDDDDGDASAVGYAIDDEGGLPTAAELKELWLEKIAEWREEAAKGGSKASSIYSKAGHSLRNCPVPFRHPSQLMQLKFIGKTMVERLLPETIKYCKDRGYPVPSKRE
jgi:hypothetical protein